MVYPFSHEKMDLLVDQLNRLANELKYGGDYGKDKPQIG